MQPTEIGNAKELSRSNITQGHIAALALQLLRGVTVPVGRCAAKLKITTGTSHMQVAKADGTW